MQLSYTHLLIGWLLLLVFYQPVLAQVSTRTHSLSCGAELTPDQVKDLQQRFHLALQRKGATRRAFTDITYVPIRPHILRRSDGTGGFELASLNEVMATTNRYFLFNGLGIQFYFAGAAPEYIDNDDLYENFGQNSPIDAHDVNNALNQYYVPVIQEGYSGYAAVPADELISTRSVIWVDNTSNTKRVIGNSTIPHELGHTFGLLHTFGYGVGNTLTDELVTRGPGANCETAGDFICDTPADPYNDPGINLIDVNGCSQYNPNSTPRDANGDPYSPSLTNIMSYWSSCTHDFTPGQYDRIQAGLVLRQSHTSYSLNAPATNVNPPTNLVASINSSSITLTWQDNASNEMGYFIERSTSPTSGFVPVGGVAPDVITFTDNQIAPNNPYYYRIRPSNTTTSNLSSTLYISSCPNPIYTVKTGSWDDPTIWSCNRVPLNTDVVQIRHIVIIPASYVANARQVSFDTGKLLSYGTNAQLKVGF